MARLSLRWRVAIAFGLGSLLITGVLAALTWDLASGYMLRQRESGATAQAQVNVRLVDGYLRYGRGGLADLLNGLATDSDTTVLLQQPGGWLTSGRQIAPEVLPRPLLDSAAHGVPAHQRLVVDRVPVLAIAWPVDSTDTYVQLFPLTQLDQAFRFLSTLLTVGVLVSALLGVATGLWAARSALRPLTELTVAASRVAGGDLQARLPMRDDPDLAALARTFNDTADALERRVRQDARFAGDVSHELRSPLTTMANAAAVLSRRRNELTGTAGRALDLLLSEVGRFQRMVVDLSGARGRAHADGRQSRAARGCRGAGSGPRVGCGHTGVCRDELDRRGRSARRRGAGTLSRLGARVPASRRGDADGRTPRHEQRGIGCRRARHA